MADNTVKVFKNRLERLLKDAEATERLFQDRGKDIDSAMWFGRVDTLRDIIAWANILSEEST